MASLSRDAPTDPAPSPAPTGLRWLWLIVAWAALGLAMLGVVLPGLPTTPFVLVAAWAAARGSQRMHRWLLAHRLFGPMIRDWQSNGAVSRRAKWAATISMALCLVILLLVTASAWAHGASALMMSLVGVWLWRRPEPRPAAPTCDPPTCPQGQAIPDSTDRPGWVPTAPRAPCQPRTR